MGDKGPGFHATHEIYYPSIGNWVCGDAQGNVHFTLVNFVKTNHAREGSETTNKIYGNLSYDLVVDQSASLTSTIGSISANYIYKNDYVFSGTNSGIYLLKGYMNCIPTGIFDKVEIVYGPDEFKTGESVAYQATFTSGDGTTYPVNWGWEIILYHSGGEYTLASDYNANNLWGAETEPLLPSYNWLIDPIGNIYGEVIVTVNISDGDFKTAKLPVSVEECTGLYLLNKTYTSSTTKQGCFVTLENVSVQNSAKLTVNSEMGVKIEKDFSMTAGTQLEIN